MRGDFVIVDQKNRLPLSGGNVAYRSVSEKRVGPSLRWKTACPCTDRASRRLPFSKFRPTIATLLFDRRSCEKPRKNSDMRNPHAHKGIWPILVCQEKQRHAQVQAAQGYDAMSLFWPLQIVCALRFCLGSVFARQTDVPAQMIVAVVSIVASGSMLAILRFVVFLWTWAHGRCSIGSLMPLTATGRGRR